MEGRFQRHALQRGVGRFKFFEPRGARVGLEGGENVVFAASYGDLVGGEQVHQVLGGATHQQIVIRQHDGRAEALAQRRFGFQSAHGQVHGFARQDGLFENEDAAGQIENGLFFGGLNPVGVAVAQVRKAALQKGPQLAQASALQAARFQILVENGLLGLAEHAAASARGPLSERIGQNAAGVIEGCGYQARAQARAWAVLTGGGFGRPCGLCGRVRQSALRKAKRGVINRHRRCAEEQKWRLGVGARGSRLGPGRGAFDERTRFARAGIARDAKRFSCCWR